MRDLVALVGIFVSIGVGGVLIVYPNDKSVGNWLIAASTVMTLLLVSGAWLSRNDEKKRLADTAVRAATARKAAEKVRKSAERQQPAAQRIARSSGPSSGGDVVIGPGTVVRAGDGGAGGRGGDVHIRAGDGATSRPDPALDAAVGSLLSQGDQLRARLETITVTASSVEGLLKDIAGWQEACVRRITDLAPHRTALFKARAGGLQPLFGTEAWIRESNGWNTRTGERVERWMTALSELHS